MIDNTIPYDRGVYSYIRQTNVVAAPIEQNDMALEENYIQLVMNETGTERDVAIETLRANHGDIVNAIMALSEDVYA